MKVHELKTWPEYFEAIIRRTKTFEIRKDDRGYQAGDFLELLEYDPETKEYTGREAEAFVAYIMKSGEESFLGLEAGHVIMAIKLRHVRQ